VYPCVGVDLTSSGVGLSFEVNLGGAPERHPLGYKESGPSPLRKERDRLTEDLDYLVEKYTGRVNPVVADLISSWKERIRVLDEMIKQIDVEAKIDDLEEPANAAMVVA